MNRFTRCKVPSVGVDDEPEGLSPHAADCLAVAGHTKHTLP